MKKQNINLTKLIFFKTKKDKKNQEKVLTTDRCFCGEQNKLNPDIKRSWMQHIQPGTRLNVEKCVITAVATLMCMKPKLIQRTNIKAQTVVGPTGREAAGGPDKNNLG